jgi:hypothetical protein
MRAMSLAAALAAAGVLGGPALADSIATSAENGFGRIVFTLDPMAHGTIGLAGGVMTIAFDRKVDFQPTAALQGLSAYVSSARMDADGRTLHLALAQAARPHTSVSGNRLAVDLVPSSFAGVPPDLPSPPTKEKAVDVSALPALAVRVAAHADYTRLVFDWPSNVAYSVFPAPGHLSIRFAAEARPDLSALEHIAPPWIKPAGWRVESGGTVLEFAIDSGSSHRLSRDGNRIVLDILTPKTDASVNSAPAKPDTKATAAKATAVSSAQAQEIASAASKLNDAEPVSEPPPKPPVPSQPSTPGFANAPHPLIRIVGPIIPTVVTPPAPPQAGVALTNGGAVLTFPNVRAAAAFIRGATAWIVVEGGPAVDVARLKSQLGDYPSSVDGSSSDGTTILRLGLKQPAQIGAQTAGGSLKVEIGPHAAGVTAAISLVRNDDDAKHAALAATLPGATHALKFADNSVGDTLIVVPASPGRAMRGTHSYLEFAALQTASGLVLAPLGDDLDVTVAQSRISITRSGGLSLTPPAVPVAASPAVLARTGEGPTFLDFANWGRGADFLATTRSLRARAVSANPGVAFRARLALAHFYLARGFAAETLGLIQLMQTADPALQGDRQLQAMRGAADYMMGRYRDARNDLSDVSFDADRHVALWRGLTEAALENWTAAQKSLAEARPELRLYPPEWQVRARLAAAQAAAGAGTFEAANAQLARLPHDLARPQMLEAQLVRAQILSASGRARDAAALFRAVESGGDEGLAARAMFGRIESGLASHSMSQASAIDALEQLRFRWRGDVLELKTLRKLAALYLGRGRWREGLQTLRAAALTFPNDDFGHQAEDDMRTAFESLFLKGKADKLAPIDALALFYDFIELTPIGPNGDEMIRRMSDRLVAVDLLGPAAKLLDYQVTNRLDGVARAQVATRLAMLDLLDHKPKEALAALRNTRTGGLPDEINHQRVLLEARALAGLKQWDQALELVALDDSSDARKLQADIYWESGNWEQAGEKAEALLPPLPPNPPGRAKLSNAERETLMRAAISYSLAANQPALDRLRAGYGARVQGGPDASAFTLVTQKVDTQGVAFRDLAAQIASIDTLETFMNDFRKRYSTTAD